jgi:hypothetical protein
MRRARKPTGPAVAGFADPAAVVDFVEVAVAAVPGVVVDAAAADAAATVIAIAAVVTPANHASRAGSPLSS